MTLIIALCIGVSHKLRGTISLAFIVPHLIRWDMLLTLGVAILLSLSWLVIIRLGVLGTIRIGIFDESRHELPHVIVVALKPAQLLLKREETTILL